MPPIERFYIQHTTGGVAIFSNITGKVMTVRSKHLEDAADYALEICRDLRDGKTEVDDVLGDEVELN